MPAKLDLVFHKEYSFKLIYLKRNWIYFFWSFISFNIEYSDFNNYKIIECIYVYIKIALGAIRINIILINKILSSKF